MLQFARWKIVVVALICLAGLVFTAPNFIAEKTAEALPEWLPHNQISLGLDLQGGLHLLLEIDTADVVKRRVDTLVDGIREELRRKRPLIGYRIASADGAKLSLNITDPTQLEDAMGRIRGLAAPLQFNPLTGTGGGNDIEITNPDGARIEIELTEEAIRDATRSALDQSIEIVRRRIDELGTREPTIQRQGDDRILVQLPGVDDPERVKNILKATAKMVFRLVDVTTTPAHI